VKEEERRISREELTGGAVQLLSVRWARCSCLEAWLGVTYLWRQYSRPNTASRLSAYAR